MTSKKITKIYRSGDLKIIKKFLWWPKSFLWEEDGSIIKITKWFEKVYILQKYYKHEWGEQKFIDIPVGTNYHNLNNMLLSKNPDDVTLAKGICGFKEESKFEVDTNTRNHLIALNFPVPPLPTSRKSNN